MGGMMGGGQVPNLKKLYSAQRVQTITYCKDTYTVTTANGHVAQVLGTQPPFEDRCQQRWSRKERARTC